MADSPVRSTAPVGGVHGFAGRPSPQPPPQPPPPPLRPVGDQAPARAADRVSVHHGATVALRLLRERVLARTRVLLELDEGHGGPEFAEVVEGEPVPAFLGRLLSAQNQLAARRAAAWSGPRIRKALAFALQQGADETLGLLAEDGHEDPLAVAVVVEVLAEFGRRLAALVADHASRDQRP